MPVCVREHEHPLRQSQLLGEEDICCSYCGFNIDNLPYGCLDCMFYLHESCALMPKKNINHPFHPQHTLDLVEFHSFSCSSCHVKFENRMGLYCTSCDFAMDLRCATMSPIEYESDGDHIKHFTHQHPLTQCEKDGDHQLTCFACQSNSSSDDLMYGCTRCRHFLHKSCANLPQKIDHTFHPQHAILLRVRNFYWCDSCHKKFQTSLSFRCDKCDFDLDIRCAQTAYMKCEGHDYIQHVTHQHPMIIYKKDDDNGIECFACKSDHSSPIYGCIPCEYFLHKSCADQFPEKIIHALHPRHPLTLGVPYGTCSYCQMSDYVFKYRCDNCNFYLDAACAMRLTTSSETHEQQDGLCYICNERSNSDHSCVPSQFKIHQSLTQLPETLEHSFHSHKPLILSTGHRNFWCDSCHRYFNDLPSYCCSECNFYMDIRCSLMPSIQYSDHEFIKHFSHQHPLVILVEESGAIDCFACQKNCPDSIYGCIRCKYFLHKSCLELPQEIEHPFHEFHPLKICCSHDDNNCNSCLKKCHGLVFRCAKCDFTVGVECAFLRPSIRHECHDHLLALIEGAHPKLDCKAYNAACALSFSSSEFKLSEHFFLRCAICDFDLHLLCGPLPSIIKHNCHLHTLTLMDSVVEDDSNEYYCDVCEEERDPRLRVYYCEKCNFISHVHCVVTEVVSALKTGAGEVKLRIVGELIDDEVEEDIKEIKSYSNSICTLKDLLDSVDEKEMRKLESCFGGIKILEESDRKVSEEECQIDNKDEDLLKKFIPLTAEQIFNPSMDINTIYAGKRACIESSEYDYKVVDVNGYLIIRELAPTLRKVFSKFGDVSVGSDFTQQGKSVVYYILCKVVNRMCRTMFNDLNGSGQFLEWYVTINFVKDAGFNLEFDEGFYSMLYDAVVGMEAERHEIKFGVRLCQSIEEANQKIAQLSAQLEELNKSKEQYESIINAPKSEEMLQNLRSAKALRWRSMGELFF